MSMNFSLKEETQRDTSKIVWVEIHLEALPRRTKRWRLVNLFGLYVSSSRRQEEELISRAQSWRVTERQREREREKRNSQISRVSREREGEGEREREFRPPHVLLMRAWMRVHLYGVCRGLTLLSPRFARSLTICLTKHRDHSEISGSLLFERWKKSLLEKDLRF